jgi:hypothetical protein
MSLTSALPVALELQQERFDFESCCHRVFRGYPIFVPLSWAD